MLSLVANDQPSNGPYFLHIEGLPKRYTWQDLKDLIRRIADHGVWTEMAVYPGGGKAGTGHARVQRANEAITLYQYLTQYPIENKRLRVHLWDISISPAQFKTCNCGNDLQYHPASASRQGARFFQMAMMPEWQRIGPTSPISTHAFPMSPTNRYASPLMVGPMTVPMQPRMAPPLTLEQLQLSAAMRSMGLDARDPAQRNNCHNLQAQQARQARMMQVAMQAPAYTGNSAGLPINVRNGAVQTEARGIFVSGLNYKAAEKDITAYFSRAGHIIQVKISRDESTNKSKGNCTIQYRTAAEAREAVRIFHRQEFMGMQLNVRDDRSRTAVGAPPASQQLRPSGGSGPTIVNGSQNRKDSAVSMSSNLMLNDRR